MKNKLSPKEVSVTGADLSNLLIDLGCWGPQRSPGEITKLSVSPGLFPPLLVFLLCFSLWSCVDWTWGYMAPFPSLMGNVFPDL